MSNNEDVVNEIEDEIKRIKSNEKEYDDFGNSYSTVDPPSD